MAARVVFYLENRETLAGIWTSNSTADMLTGCWMFDTSAVMYTNAIIVIALLLPYPTRLKRHLVPILFTVINALCLAMNLGDAVYFRFSGRRTTMSVLQEFSHEDNISGIVATEFVNHWYLLLVFIMLTAAIYWCARAICRWLIKDPKPSVKAWHEWLLAVVGIALFTPLCIGGMRGGLSHAVRPITISNANQYVSHPQEAALILNTPFSILRTIGKQTFRDPQYFTQQELQGIYTPVHTPATQTETRGLNVVILIVESFAREYIGELNHDLEGGRYRGYTPQIDQLVRHSVTFTHSYANGRKSIDGMPSILSGIPMFVEPFFLTPASLNTVSGLARELGSIGYQTAFFHGAENGSMGFEAFARATGFQRYYGRTEYNQDPRFHGDDDFDGMWAIWDEPFLQYYATKMSEMKQPFMTAVFTASSHHPFNIPKQYEQQFTNDTSNPIHRCIRYTDMSLGRFFETAARQPWYKNTVFVLTADHTNGTDHPEYGTDLGLYSVPIIIYDPSGRLMPTQMDKIAQQTDIMPTVLSMLGYPKPYVSFGVDLLNTPAEDCWAVNYNNGIYQFLRGDYFLQFDGRDLKGVYLFRKDRLLRHNLLPQLRNDPVIITYQRQLKAIIQQYMQRMLNDQLTVSPNAK